MFMLKSLFSKIWKDESNVELIQIPAGVLYIVRPNSVKGERECIYKDAVATIRRTTTQHKYQLVITRAYEEGEEQLIEQDDDPDDELSFLIDPVLHFRPSTSPSSQSADVPAPSFAWRDPDGDVQDHFEFVCDAAQVNEITRSIFEMTYLQCLYERVNDTSHENASVEDIEKLKWKGDGADTTTDSAAADLSAQLGDLSVSATSSPAKKSTSSPSKGKQRAGSDKPAIPAAPASDAVPTVPGQDAPTVLLTAIADLYLYDQASGLFMTQEKGANAEVIEAGRYLYWLSISGPTRAWLSQSLSASMNMSFSVENLSAVWNYFDEQSHCYSWLLRFADAEAYNAFQQGLTKLMWQTLNEESWEKAKSDERQYVQQAYEEDVEMTSVDEENEEDEVDKSIEAVQRKSAPKRRSNGRDWARRDDQGLVEEEDSEEEGRNPDDEEHDDDEEADSYIGNAVAGSGMGSGGNAKDVNSLLAVGYKNDRSFVVRGNRIGVFAQGEDDQLRFDTTINRIADTKGRDFVPQKIMLHDQDSALIMQDPSNAHSLFKMDLEYGKIVEEWNVHPDVGISTFVPDSKYAQTTGTKTLVGASHNAVYRIDPRLAGDKLVDSQFKQYATKNGFTAAATDEKGRLAVASSKGDIRLFDQIGKNAKTALPALGDPILGVDVTADGRYIVATCKTYLLLIDTLIGDGRYKGALGFDRSFPADSKPIPRRLQLKPHHVAYMDQPVSFTPARFNVGDNDETSIVTSSGPFVVTFDLAKVKRGQLAAYQLVRLDDNVVQDQYSYGTGGKRIVVAMPHDVQLTRRAQLKKPTRESLTARPSASRSSIVDERY